MSGASSAFWDDEADRFDEQPDHGLRDPVLSGGPIEDERYLVVSRSRP